MCRVLGTCSYIFMFYTPVYIYVYRYFHRNIDGRRIHISARVIHIQLPLKRVARCMLHQANAPLTRRKRWQCRDVLQGTYIIYINHWHIYITLFAHRLHGTVIRYNFLFNSIDSSFWIWKILRILLCCVVGSDSLCSCCV